MNTHRPHERSAAPDRPSCMTNNTCRPQLCTIHADCTDSDTCLPDGSCAMVTQVAFVDSTGGTENAMCSRERPCRTIASALATSRSYICLHGTFDELVVIEGGRHVALFADANTTLTSSTPDFPVVRVASAGTSVAIHDLHIVDVTNPVYVIDVAPASGSPSLALYHVTISRDAGIAISIGDGQITMDRTTLDHNASGGLAVFSSAQFTVSNSLIVENGSPYSSYGGIRASSDASAHNVVVFTTVHGNIATRGTPACIPCVGAQTVITNTIVVENGLSGSTTSQAAGNCQFRHTRVYPGPPPAGEGNVGQDPKLVNPAAGDFRPSADSPAIGAADPTIPATCAAERDLDDTQRPDTPTIGALEPASQGPSPPAVRRSDTVTLAEGIPALQLRSGASRDGRSGQRLGSISTCDPNPRLPLFSDRAGRVPLNGAAEHLARGGGCHSTA